MLLTMIVVMAGILAVVPLVLGQYVHRLPWAPECPHCHTVTQAAHAGLFDRLCALVAATPVRHCARCGWAGRMRWRLAHERARNRQ
jgi:hypothetical protein